MRIQNKRYYIVLICFSFLLATEIWLSTGTLAPYAATLENPREIECGYIANYDHNHYEANFKFLDKEPKDTWYYGWLHRRILFYVLSFPFMKLFGFLYGGVITSFMINIIAFISFLLFIKKKLGEKESYVAMLLLSSYPGITYWAGLPYAQVMLVPCILWISMCMWEISHNHETKNVIKYSLLIGVTFMAYDIFIYFIPAVVLLLFFLKRYKAIPISAGLMILPLFITILIEDFFGANTTSDNTNIYLLLLKSCTRMDFGALLDNIKALPWIFYRNYLDSNFIFLPVLFLLSVSFGIIFKKIYLSKVEISILLSVFFVFLFNNMPPSYEGWQMRGVWIARIYQPFFIVIILYVVRLSGKIFDLLTGSYDSSLILDQVANKVFLSLIIITFMANLLITFGPVFKTKFSSGIYRNFYHHSWDVNYKGDEETMLRNLEKYGARPLGFCRETSELNKKQ